MNWFIFEYHFAFYYVTKQFTESNMTKYDSRGLRTSSCFGGRRPDANTPVRHIHEEQMSFFLAGDGTGRYYCYQLGEKYFMTLLNNEERTCVYSAGWTPSTLFLSWIAMALHHVGIRWQNAIEAVDELVDSEKEVVFHKKKSFDLDQRAKDQTIGQLQTYFWALEAYKLFEDSLTKTVEAWEHFKRGSLHRVNDSRNDGDYDVSVELIELSIERLRSKIDWVCQKSKQVAQLREGLSFAAQISDTSVGIS